jgi:tetratricopeptide (TPR) repeat protein
MNLPVPAKLLLAIPLLIILATLSCGQPEKPVTAEEAKKFAKTLERSMELREGEFFNESLDKRELLRRAGYLKKFNSQSVPPSLNNSMNIGTSLLKSMSDKGTYQLIKQYEKDKIQHLLFRMFDRGGLMYHDLELINTKGKTRIADLYVYTTGENLSATLKDIYKQMDKIEDATKMDNDKWLGYIPRIKQLIADEKEAEANELYNEMPAAVRNLKVMQILHISISAGIDSAEYNNALAEYNRLYPNEPTSYLLSIDGYYFNKQYQKGLDAINKLDKLIDKDPILDYHRYLFYNLLKENEKAKECLLRLLTNMPLFESGILELIATYIEEKDYTAAIPWIEKFRAQKKFEQTVLDQLMTGIPALEKYNSLNE